MRCRYCNQRLNVFKSLAGSSFCSQEHRKLYEEAEANKGFERLLQFVEKNPKSGPAKPIASPAAAPAVTTDKQEPSTAAPATAEPQTILAKVEKPEKAERGPDPPVAGFLLEPIAPSADSASSHANVNFDILESVFSPEPPALPSWRFEIAATDLQKPAEEPVQETVEQPPESSDRWSPPPLASWSDFSLREIKTPNASIELPSVGSVRPRGIALELPSPENRPPGPGVAPSPFLSDAPGLQLAIQAVLDNRDFANLARLNPLHREVRTAPEKAQWPRGPQPLGTLGAKTVPSRVLAGVQDAPAPGQPPVFPPRLKGQMPAMQPPAEQPAVAGFPRRAFASLKLAQLDKSTTIAMNGAMTRAGAARAICQPQVPGSRLVSTLGSSENLDRVVADLQNTPSPRDYAISLARFTPQECIVPRVEPTTREFAAANAPVIDPISLTIRTSDAAVAVGITDVTKPELVARRLLTPDVPAARLTVTIGFKHTARNVLPQVQAKEGARGCAISAPRQAQRECLLPAFLWSTETCLRSSVASVGWFHAGDSVRQSFPAAPPAPRLFSIRVAPDSFHTDVPALAVDRAARRLTLEPARREQEAQTLARSQPSRSSPLSLVVLPQTFVKRPPVRYVAYLNRFASISNPVGRGAMPSAAASTPAEERKLVLALPQFTGSRSSFALLLSSHAAVKSPLTEPADGKNAGAAPGPHPSPVRAQPASMLVLPGLASEHSALLSLHSLADVLRVDPAITREFATFRPNPRRPSISLDLGVQTSEHDVPAANALPRRTGPRLPVVTAQLNGLIVTGR